MLKEYLKDKRISVYALSKESGIAYSTLNDLVNGKVGIGNCKGSLIRSLSSALGMSMDELYDLCLTEMTAIDNSYHAEASLGIRAKYYYARLKYGEETAEIRLCKVNENNSYYINEIARWRVESLIRERRMKEFR